MLTAPEDTVKLLALKDATPFVLVLAFIPARVTAAPSPDPVILSPEPAVTPTLST
jgi:hypothetical protein